MEPETPNVEEIRESYSLDGEGSDFKRVKIERGAAFDRWIAAYAAEVREDHAKSLAALANAMLEYAQAIRGDWSDFDGRTERDVIESWVSEIRSPEFRTLEEWRDELNICPDGNGHWAGTMWGHCTDDQCPVNAKREGR